jgi:hypothetical protein
MTISINSSFNLMTISSTALDTFVASPSNYIELSVKGYHNSTTSFKEEKYSVSNPITNLTNIATGSGIEYIKPEFFDNGVFTDGVYHFIFTFKSENEIVTEEACIFVDKDFKCKIDDYRINEVIPFEKRMFAVSDYFLLKNTSECQCKCGNLIEIYNNLIEDFDFKKCFTC